MAGRAKMYHGKPCPNCGATLRYVSSRGCKACGVRRERERYANDPQYRERRLLKGRRGKQKHPEWAAKQRERLRNDPEYREQILTRIRARNRERYRNDPEYRRKLLERARDPRVRERASSRRRYRRSNDPEYAERVRATDRRRAENRSGYQTNRHRLYQRRWAAQKAMAERNRDRDLNPEREQARARLQAEAERINRAKMEGHHGQVSPEG